MIGGVEMDNIINEYKNLLQTLLLNPQLPFDNALHRSLPEKGGVYRIFEKDQSWQSSVYVGKTSNLSNRIYTNHLMGNKDASTLKKKLIKSGKFADKNDVKSYLQSKCLVQYVEVSDELYRTFFEHFAVSVLKPKYND